MVAAAVLATLALGVGATVATVQLVGRPDVPSPAAGAAVSQGSATAPLALPPPPQAQLPPVVPGRAQVAGATAPCVSAPSQDAGGRATSYEPQNVLDGRADTAWRCDGDGIGQQLRISFGGVVTLTRIGIIPGLAKVDPYDSTDRYAQNRRISAVRYTFDDGTHIDQLLDTSVWNRTPQQTSLPFVQSSSITVTILGSVAGSSQNRQQALHKVAISEIVVS